MTSKRPYWDLYKQQMSKLNNGHAMWEPSPFADSQRIRPGDVGYLRTGGFTLLFSASTPLEERRPGFDVPRTFKQLYLGNIDQRAPLPAGALCTNGVRATVSLPPSQPPSSTPSPSPSLPCVPSAIFGASDPNSRAMGSEHYDSWVTFAHETGHGDVNPILVTGVDRTRDFVMLCYSKGDDDDDLSCEFTTSVPGLTGWGTWNKSGLVYTNHGPQLRYPPSSSSSGDGNPVSISDEYNQCVFIRYYTVRKRLGIPRIIKAAAGPHKLGGGGHNGDRSPLEPHHDLDQDSDSGSESDTASSLFDDDDGGSVTSIETEPDIMVHNTTADGRDDFDIIADYVFQNSDAHSVLLHHEDITLLHESGGSKDLSTLVSEKRPPITVDGNGVGTIRSRTDSLAETRSDGIPAYLLSFIPNRSGPPAIPEPYPSYSEVALLQPFIESDPGLFSMPISPHSRPVIAPDKERKSWRTPSERSQGSDRRGKSISFAQERVVTTLPRGGLPPPYQALDLRFARKKLYSPNRYSLPNLADPGEECFDNIPSQDQELHRRRPESLEPSRPGMESSWPKPRRAKVRLRPRMENHWLDDEQVYSPAPPTPFPSAQSRTTPRSPPPMRRSSSLRSIAESDRVASRTPLESQYSSTKPGPSRDLPYRMGKSRSRMATDLPLESGHARELLTVQPTQRTARLPLSSPVTQLLPLPLHPPSTPPKTRYMWLARTEDIFPLVGVPKVNRGTPKLPYTSSRSKTSSRGDAPTLKPGDIPFLDARRNGRHLESGRNTASLKVGLDKMRTPGQWTPLQNSARIQSYLPRTEPKASRFRNGIYNELSGVPEFNIEDPGKPMVRTENSDEESAVLHHRDFALPRELGGGAGLPTQLQDEHQRDSRILQELYPGGMIRLQPSPLGMSHSKLPVSLGFVRAERFGNDEHRSDFPPSPISRTIAHADHRIGLDNFLQVNGGSGRLLWEAVRTGLQHRLTWTAICYIDNIQYAKASNPSLSQAKESAAHTALRVLSFQRFCQLTGLVLT